MELRAIFAAVLNRELLEAKFVLFTSAITHESQSQVPISSSFFALGGHSIAVGQLVNRIRRELKLPAAIADVYGAPSVQLLAARLLTKEGSCSESLNMAPSDQSRYPASFQQFSLQRMATVSAAASAALNLAFCCHVSSSASSESRNSGIIAHYPHAF